MTQRTDRSPAYAADVDGLGALRLDPLDPSADAGLVHAWVALDSARFWMMQDHTEDDVREIYTWVDEQPTHHAWLARRRRAGQPVPGLPDVRNEKSVALLERLGLELGPVVELSTKPAQLAFFTREQYAASRPPR